MAFAGSVGIDLGGSTAVIAVAKKGGVEVIINEASNRETHVVAGFGENERFIGEAGYVQLKSNFKNTIVYPHRFLGIRADAPHFNEEKKWLYNTVNTTPDNKAVFEVMYRGEKKQFTPEQITASVLQKIKQIIKKTGVAHNDAVISVPSYYTEQERKALLDSAKIAEVNVLKLINESSAIAYGYGIFRKAELDANPRNVVFVDFGHCNSSVFLASFTNTKGKVLNQHHERNLGVRDIDWKLLEFYSKICVEQFEGNPMKKDKTRLRLIDAIEKQRKVLSANIEAVINVDYIVEENDLSYHLTREKLEEIAQPIIDRFRNLIETLKAEITVPIHSVEIVGGGSRIPIIQRLIQEIFGMECSKTLNASECIARGAAIQAAILSPFSKVAAYEVEEANCYPIRCAWTFKDTTGMDVESDSKNNPEKQTSILFQKGCSIPNVKSVTFHRDDNIEFKLFYDPIPPGADGLLAQYFIKGVKPKEADFGVKLRVLLNKNGIVEFDSAYLNEDYLEEVPADNKMVEEPKPGEPEKPKPEPKKKTRATKLTADISIINNLTEKEISNFFEEECQMANQDRITHETYDKKNELESYIYEMRNHLGERYDAYVLAQQKESILQALQKTEDWLYSDGAKTTKSIYSSKLEELKKLGDPIVNRYKESETFPQAVADFYQNLGVYEGVATSTDAAYEHITAEEKKGVLDAVKEHKEWLAKSSDTFSKAKKTENFPVTSTDILGKHKAFVDKHYATINKPKPKPAPKTEPPKEEKPKEGGEKGAEDNKGEGEKKEMEVEK